MTMRILCVLLVGFSLVSCGWDENPLKGKSPGVQQGNVPNSESPQPGDNEESLRIETDDFLSFTEENEGQFSIRGRVLIPDAEFELNIENMREFPGATFDLSTGIFQWKPAAGTVLKDYVKKMDLQVFMVTKNVSPVRFKRKNVPVYVAPNMKAPSVLSVDFESGKASVREGERAYFSIVVKDETALDLDGYRPQVYFGTTDGGDPEAATFIEKRSSCNSGKPNPMQDAADKSLWTFCMMVDLYNKEVTTSSNTVSLKIFALSRFKVISPVRTGSLQILTNLSAPLSTWTATQNFQEGAKNNFTYTIYNPRGEGEITHTLLTNCESIHPQLKCGTCVKQRDPVMGGILQCPVSWDIPPDYLSMGGRRDVNIEVELMNKSTVLNDPYTSPVKKVISNIRVFPATVPLSQSSVSGGN